MPLHRQGNYRLASRDCNLNLSRRGSRGCKPVAGHLLCDVRRPFDHDLTRNPHEPVVSGAPLSQELDSRNRRASWASIAFNPSQTRPARPADHYLPCGTAAPAVPEASSPDPPADAVTNSDELRNRLHPIFSIIKAAPAQSRSAWISWKEIPDFSLEPASRLSTAGAGLRPLPIAGGAAGEDSSGSGVLTAPLQVVGSWEQLTTS
jgi:hypothetical protein